MAGGRQAAVFKAALQRAARARTLALAAARRYGRPMRMHTYGSRRCGPAGSRGGKGRERISSPCTQSDEDSAPVGEQQLVKKSLAGFTCRSSEMTSARVPNAERLTTPARPGGRKRERKIGPASSALGQKLVLGHLKKETMVTVGPLPGALKPRLRYETSSNRLWPARVRPARSGPTDRHPSIRPARPQSINAVTPPRWFRRSFVLRSSQVFLTGF